MVLQQTEEEAGQREAGEGTADGRASLREQGAISFIHSMPSFSHPETFLVHLLYARHWGSNGEQEVKIPRFFTLD